MRAADRMSAPPLRASLVAALLALAAAGPGAASEGVAYRVKDLDPTPPVPVTRGFALDPMASSATAAGRLVFGSDSEAGFDPWVTDGTGEGTRRLRDLRSQPYNVSALAGEGGFYFTASSPGTGDEVWWTDGTTAGTRLVRDVRMGRGGSDPRLLGVVAGVLYFVADEGVHGHELWRSDGTWAGTYLLADLMPGGEGSEPGPATVFGGRLFFAADDGVHGRELWRTENSPSLSLATVTLVADLSPGGADGAPDDFREAAGLLFFAAQDPGHGRELWVTDGTPGGTAFVMDLAPGAAGSDPEPLGAVPGGLVFAADDGIHGRTLWVSDGSGPGTSLLNLVEPQTWDPNGPLESAQLDGRVVFAGYDGPIHGLEPWITDGTPAGTRLLADLAIGGLGSSPRGFARTGDAIVFGARTADGDWLWRTDGTLGGTSVLAGLGADHTYRVSPALAAGEGWVIRVTRYQPPSYELWFTDGSAAGTAPVVATTKTRSPSSPDWLRARAAGLVFGALDAEVFESDGSEAGTKPLVYTGPGLLRSLTESARLPGGELVFDAVDDGGAGPGLFRSDGDTASPVLFFQAPALEALTRSGDLVYFGHRDEVQDAQELWRTDGTAGGTTMLRSFHRIASLADVFGEAWFWTTEDDSAWSLWRSAGTAATTLEVPLAGISVQSYPRVARGLDPETGSVLFAADDGLYRLDPTSGIVNLVLAGPSLGHLGEGTILEGRFYFFGEGQDGNCRLWSTDGTAAGTSNVRTWSTGSCFASPIVVVGQDLLFAACGVPSGCELWRSDGTTAGTALVEDIDPGYFSSMPAALTSAGGRLYFVACDATAGCEPWVSDGTAAGTHRVADIAPGPESSLAGSGHDHLTPWTRLVFFAADDGTGTELWATPVEIFYDGFESGDTSRW